MSNLIIHEQLMTNCPFTKFTDPIVRIIYLCMSKEITIPNSHQGKFVFAIFRIWKLLIILPRQWYEDFNGLYYIENWRTLISWYVMKLLPLWYVMKLLPSIYLRNNVSLEIDIWNYILRKSFPIVKKLEEATRH